MSQKRYASFTEWDKDHSGTVIAALLWRDAIAEGEARAEDRRPRLTREQVEQLRFLIDSTKLARYTKDALRAALAALGEAADPQPASPPEWQSCDWQSAEQWRQRTLTGSIGLEGRWSEWQQGKPVSLEMHRQYEYRRRAATLWGG